MIPPRFIPPGVIQLFRVDGGERELIQELPASSKNRDRINRTRNDLLMVDSTLTLIISENNALK